jgi:E3 ubiquitin-protein ligase HUWE1
LLNSLLNDSDADSSRRYRPFMALILRHIIEHPSLLQSTMEREVVQFYNQQNQQTYFSVDALCRAAAPLIARDPMIFLSTIENVCELTNAEDESFNIKLRPEIKQVLKSHNEKSRSDGSNPSEHLPKKSLPGWPSTGFTDLNPILESTMDFLMDEFQAVYPTSFTSSETNAGADSSSEQPLSRYHYACYILSMIAELVASYPPCKTAFVSWGKRKATVEDHKHKPSYVNYLLQDVIPVNSLNPLDKEDIVSAKKEAFASLATTTLVSLCFDPYGASTRDKDLYDLASIRKNVLEGVLKSFKDCLASSLPADRRYGRLQSLGDLCHQLLTGDGEVDVGEEFRFDSNVCSRGC